ncbi:hypothetical protein DTL70_04295 [Streptomyces diacarni]|uniref:Uncharacterized protein n=1 Tax=Streptomyces diacarni TaxID=2800381 RepID=A0A367FB42_9ACTN|nr:hypothetical protein DTL70_04295 [Streptomyces diacarni]
MTGRGADGLARALDGGTDAAFPRGAVSHPHFAPAPGPRLARRAAPGALCHGQVTGTVPLLDTAARTGNAASLSQVPSETAHAPTGSHDT